MKRTVIVLLALFLVFGLCSSASAQSSPSVNVDFDFDIQGFGGPGFGAPGFTGPDFSTPKMALDPVDLNSLSNMTVGGFVPVSFNLPPTFAGEQLIWTSSNPDVANVTSFKNRALVHGKAPGTAVITVRTPDGRFSYSFTVVVN